MSDQEKPDLSAHRFCWNECMTTDVDAAKSFYSQLFGWTFETMTMGHGDYHFFKRPGDENPQGGMMQMPPEAAGAPSHWMAYVSVDDVDASVKKAQELGGTVIVPKMALENP